jgi:hypothetical protein
MENEEELEYNYKFFIPALLSGIGFFLIWLVGALSHHSFFYEWIIEFTFKNKVYEFIPLDFSVLIFLLGICILPIGFKRKNI